jgi:poly-gamma-glutamate synthesis protein (capsule biosynthesis protein)
MLGRLVNSVLSNDNYTYVWGDTIDIIRNSDISLINLECAISSKGKKWDKTFKVFHFRANPEAIDVLKIAKIDYVSLSNNHVLDYDVEALEETLELLDKNGILHSGAGRDLNEAMQPAIIRYRVNSKKISIKDNSSNNTHNILIGNGVIKKNDNGNHIRVGVVSLTDNQPEWEATKETLGINYIPITLSSKEEKKYLDRLQFCIGSVKKNSDIVVVSSHVGPHYRENPSSTYIKFAHKIIDLGADIYWGHSNHMPQGIEIYKNKIIMYDCGDFIDDYAVDPHHRNDLSFIFLIHIDDLKEEDGDKDNKSNLFQIKEIELIPTIIHDFKANIAMLDDAKIALSNMIKRCNYLKTKCIVDKKSKRIKIPLL